MFATTRIKRIEGDMAELQFIRGLVRLADLEAVPMSAIEKRFWATYPNTDDVAFW